MTTPESQQAALRYNAKQKELLFTHCQLKTLTSDVIDAFGHCTEYLDLSHNRLDSLQWIYAFERSLKCLILDSNRLHEAALQQLQQPLERVRLLSLNRNEVLRLNAGLMDLKTSIEALSCVFPNLEYLSLHGNPICPDGLELKPFSEYVCYEYEFYRTFISRAFKKLKFLDHYDLKRVYVPKDLPIQKTPFLTFQPKIVWSKLVGGLSFEERKPLSQLPQRFVGFHFGTIRKLAAKDSSTQSDTESECNRHITNQDL